MKVNQNKTTPTVKKVSFGHVRNNEGVYAVDTVTFLITLRNDSGKCTTLYFNTPSSSLEPVDFDAFERESFTEVPNARVFFEIKE